MVETLAVLVVRSRFVGCVDRLRKLAARFSACPQLTDVVCWNVCSSRLQVDSLMVCTFASGSVSGVGCKCWRIVCALVAILPRVNRASVALLVVCMQDSKQESTQEETCSAWPVLGANGCGVYVARWLSLCGVGMRGLYSTLDNVYSVGVLRLLSMRRANTISSKVARLYVLRFYVTRCMRGGIYGRTYGALSFAHGIG